MRMCQCTCGRGVELLLHVRLRPVLRVRTGCRRDGRFRQSCACRVIRGCAFTRLALPQPQGCHSIWMNIAMILFVGSVSIL